MSMEAIDKEILRKKAYLGFILGAILICSPVWLYNLNIKNQYNASHLTYIKDKVDHYYIHRHNKNSTTIVVLKNGSKYWIPSINQNSSNLALLENGAAIELYANTEQAFAPIDGAVKSYGLLINGREISTPSEDVKVYGYYIIFTSVMCLVFSVIFIKIGISNIRDLRLKRIVN